MPTPSEKSRPRSRLTGRASRALNGVPPLLMLLGVFATLTLTLLVTPFGQGQDEARFDMRVATAQTTLSTRLESYFAILHAGAALFAASRQVEPSEWASFVRALELEERFPGSLALGYAQREQDRYRSRLLYPDDASNRGILGTLVGLDPARAGAMALARDTATIQVTDRVRLLQHLPSGPATGFLIYYPVYAGGRDPGSTAERRRLLEGFVYAPFRGEDLFGRIFASQEALETDFAVFDGDPAPGHLLFARGMQGPPPPPGSPLVRYRPLRLGGQSWTIVYRAVPGFANPAGHYLTGVVLLAGLLVSFLASAMAGLLVSARRGAEQEIARRTEALTAANAELQARSAELTAANAELKALSHTLDSERQLTERLITEAPILIAYIDKDRVYRWGNPVHEKSLGVPRSEYLGRPVKDFVSETVYRQVSAIYDQVLAGLEIVKGVSSAALDKAHPENVRDWEYTYVPVHGTNGEAEGVLVLAQDVTERIAEARRQEEQIERLEEIDRLKDQFLGVLSHELRTPLNAVFGFASILADEIAGPLNAEQHAYLERLIGGTEVLLALINDLLDMSRIQAGKFSLSPHPLDLRPVVEDTLSNLASLAEQKAIRLAVDMPPELPPVEGDPQRLGQVLVNLVGNAIKFSGPGTDVLVRVERREGELRVAVVDAGPGISAADQERLFKPFTQLEATGNTRSNSGTGLGLSIAKALVEAHGGKIGLTSAPGKGSTFWFSVPCCHPDPTSALAGADG